MMNTRKESLMAITHILQLNQIQDSEPQENISNTRETIIGLAPKLESTHFGLNKKHEAQGPLLHKD